MPGASRGTGNVGLGQQAVTGYSAGRTLADESLGSPDSPGRPSVLWQPQAAKTASETAMWTCRICNAHFAFDEVEAHADESEIFFVCRACDYRNRLCKHRPKRSGASAALILRHE
jgi:hypothetical protein